MDRLPLREIGLSIGLQAGFVKEEVKEEKVS